MAEYTLEAVNKAVASAVAAAVPDAAGHIYDSPRQQSTGLPAVFLNYRGEQKLKKQIGNRWLQTLRMDIVYLVEPNLPNEGSLLRDAAGALDYALETLTVGGECIRALDRQWHTERGELHYQLDLRLRLSMPHSADRMETMDLTEGFK